MTLSSYQHHIALLSHHTCRADSLTTIYYCENLLHLLTVQTCKHIVKDILWFLETGIVGSEYHLIALSHSLLRHDRTFTLVTITTSSTDGYHLTFSVEHLMNCREYILQCIGGVGVVHNSRIAIGC